MGELGPSRERVGEGRVAEVEREKDRWTFVLVWGVRKREIGREEEDEDEGRGGKGN